MKTQFENYIYDERHYGEINAIASICTGSHDETDLRVTIENDTADWHIDGVQWGFGCNHFWLAEEHGSAGFKRILFVDFTDQD